MKQSNFVHLHVHSQYSLLDGACLVQDLVDTAKQMHMPAVAITDHGNIFGAIEFYSIAKQSGIKPIIGCETYLAKIDRFKKTELGKRQPIYHLPLLVKNLAGYKNLIKLVTASYLEGFYYKPRIDKQILSEYVKGLIGLSGCLKGEIASLILAGEKKEAYTAAQKYKDMFEKKSFYLELMDHNIAEQVKVNKVLIEISRKLDIPLVATNDVHYLKQDMAQAHEVLLCLQTQTMLADKKRMRFSTNEFYFKSEAEMQKIFSQVPEALSNTVEVSQMCDLEIDFKSTHLPNFELPEHTSDIEELRQMCETNVVVSYPEMVPQARLRLDRELDVIKGLGFASYFLIVSDFVRFAKESHIPVGPGRGSAAGSIVSYLIGITDIDPLKYDLLFERFLNPDRVSFPDIDIDFCYERRDEVIKYVNDKYGRENVAQIITFGTMAAKGVIRDVGRVLGIPYA
ncbi:MAG: DNA polymerase III subunit alpha, partial [Candidatus Omnitrophota bacterium]